jgi:hypothetical protein
MLKLVPVSQILMGLDFPFMPESSFAPAIADLLLPDQTRQGLRLNAFGDETLQAKYFISLKEDREPEHFEWQSCDNSSALVWISIGFITPHPSPIIHG